MVRVSHTQKRYTRLFAVLGLASGFWMGPVWGHDIYNTLRDGSPVSNGQLCCGGDEKTGDCEGIGTNYREASNGDWIFISRRYGAEVRVGKNKVTWLPVPGGEANEAHWCGVPRTKVVMAPVTADNPDEAFWTYCAFIAPGGV